MEKRMLILENGKTFRGRGFGADGTKIAELIFNTSMTGYQEILSDAACCNQIAVMSYPLIGNYGLADDDYQSKGIYLSGMIVREYNDQPSNFRFTKTLAEAMADAGVCGIEGVDTREIVKILRDVGVMKAMITDASRDIGECLEEIKNHKPSERPVETVSAKKTWHARTRNPLYTVAVVDCGVKFNTIRKFNLCGCNVAVVPFNTPYSEIEKLKPDGLFISNGAGNPAELSEVIGLIKNAKGKLPILGEGLGLQLIALAYGASTFKMKFGHRGANQPVKNLKTGKVEITSQNHGYAVEALSLKNTGIEITHAHLLDNDVEGIADLENNVIGLQYLSDGADGPEDSVKLFGEFIAIMKAAGGNRNAQENRY